MVWETLTYTCRAWKWLWTWLHHHLPQAHSGSLQYLLFPYLGWLHLHSSHVPGTVSSPWHTLLHLVFTRILQSKNYYPILQTREPRHRDFNLLVESGTVRSRNSAEISNVLFPRQPLGKADSAAPWRWGGGECRTKERSWRNVPLPFRDWILRAELCQWWNTMTTLSICLYRI